MLEITLNRHLVGGLRLAANKTASTAGPIVRGFVPPRLVLAMHQHAGNAAEPVVAVGQRVAKGELVGKPGPSPSAAVHASSSGTVTAIEERLVPTGTGLHASLCVVVETDGEDRAATVAEAGWPADRAAQLERIAQGGLAGLGGAVFPTAAKLAAAGSSRAVIVNGAECEPYISCDDLLMREAPEQIVAGALLLADLTSASECIIAIERDKPKALEAVGAAARVSGDPRLRLAGVPTVYPAGGERQLIQLLTGEEVPSGRYPNAIGYVCHNVGTAYALARLAMHAEPLVSRIVTVTGGGVGHRQNLEVPIGTPIADLIERCGGYRNEVVRLIHGGSMMGYALPNDGVPVTKATSCVIAATAVEIRQSADEWACIRCGDCANVCPARLLPQEIYFAALARDFGGLADLGLDDCIECGCCDVACPSHISLTEHFRVAKHETALHERRLALSEAAERRHASRERRLEALESKVREAQEDLRSAVRGDEHRQEAIRAAVERARQRRREGSK
ncbi:MAG TPA: electron transport complex subunit RsxC [Gammaproteobacteria bacterium]|nr:electron transport complex subunit RsxC [Gammaproteobacteria bacterium]